jgi:hypothetical protein
MKIPKISEENLKLLEELSDVAQFDYANEYNFNRFLRNVFEEEIKMWKD